MNVRFYLSYDMQTHFCCKNVIILSLLQTNSVVSILMRGVNSLQDVTSYKLTKETQ